MNSLAKLVSTKKHYKVRKGRIKVGALSGPDRLTISAESFAPERIRTFEPSLGYGYLWRVFDPSGGWNKQLSGAFTASGAYGQFITVIPKLQMVIAHKTIVPPPRNVSAADYLE